MSGPGRVFGEGVGSAFEMVEGRVGGDAARPGFETARGIEAGMSAMNAPEGFDCKIFGEGGIADDDHDPAVDLGLMPAEQGLEGVDVAACELLQDV